MQVSHSINFQAFRIIILAHSSSQAAESPDGHVVQRFPPSFMLQTPIFLFTEGV